MTTRPVLRAAVAEGIGTFFLVLMGPGAVMVNAWSDGALGPTGIALAFAFVVVAMIYTLGHLSGAHLNPAVTLTFWRVGRFPLAQVPAYLLAQCAGGVLASALMVWLLGPVGFAGATLPHIGILPSLVIEFLFSFLLMLVIMAVATDDRVAGGFAGLAVGLAVGCCALLGPLTGSSMNPARSLGPALLSGRWEGHWLYWLGPVLGMGAAGMMYEWLRPSSPAGVDSPSLDPA
jgi:aquaporin Z